MSLWLSLVQRPNKQWCYDHVDSGEKARVGDCRGNETNLLKCCAKGRTQHRQRPRCRLIRWGATVRFRALRIAQWAEALRPRLRNEWPRTCRGQRAPSQFFDKRTRAPRSGRWRRAADWLEGGSSLTASAISDLTEAIGDPNASRLRDRVDLSITTPTICSTVQSNVGQFKCHPVQTPRTRLPTISVK